MTGIAEIENAILARLKAAGHPDTGVLGYRFRHLETYPADFDAWLGEKMAGDQYPAAWVVFGGWRRPSDQGSALQAEAVFMVVVAAQSVRNETAQRHGATPAEVGSYQLMLDAAALLHGQRLGLDIGALQLGPCRSVRPTETILKRKLSLYALEFTTLLPIEVSRFPDSALDDFATFHADWDVPPIGNVSTDLPAPAPAEGEGAADASDTLQMEQEEPAP